MRFVVFVVFFAALLLMLGCVQSNLPKTQVQYNTTGSNFSSVSTPDIPTLSDESFVVPDFEDSGELTEEDYVSQLDELSAFQLPAVDYYYSSGCSASKTVAPIIAKVESDFSGLVYFREHNVFLAEGFAEYKAFAAKFNIPVNQHYVPVLLVGNKTLTSIDELTYQNITKVLSWYVNQSG